MHLIIYTFNFIGSHNVALGKKAIQSTQYQSLGPSLAVDGNLNTNMHSQPDNAQKWWHVNLGDRYQLTHMTIHNTPGNKCSVIKKPIGSLVPCSHSEVHLD